MTDGSGSGTGGPEEFNDLEVALLDGDLPGRPSISILVAGCAPYRSSNATISEWFHKVALIKAVEPSSA